MTTYFAEVLAIEHAALAHVSDCAGIARWRRRVVREVMKPESPYASALRQSTDVDAGPEFLTAWRELLTTAVERVLRSRALPETGSIATRGPRSAPDAERLAVLILAALHGGGTLSRVAADPAPLEAALDIALAPLTAGPPVDDADAPTNDRTVT
jgi:hypothetical protein